MGLEGASPLRTNGLIDHDRLFKGISSKLPADSNKELLRELVKIYRREARECLEEWIQESVGGVGSDRRQPETVQRSLLKLQSQPNRLRNKVLDSRQLLWHPPGELRPCP